MQTDINAALIGQVLDGGWVVEAPRPRAKDATGSYHCFPFTAKHPDGRRAFVKVLDPIPDSNLADEEQLPDLQRRLAFFNYEHKLLQKCLTKKIRRVVEVLGRGSLKLPGFPIAVHYLMFELAERDLREHATLNHTLNVALNLQILHQTSLALEALHFNKIAHNDIKPSNVLLFSELVTKLGDLGHAHDKGAPRPDSDDLIAGDPGHAPLEHLYGYRLVEWNARRLSTDLYLLGSLVVFMFTNTSMTAQIGGQLLPQHHWEAWPGNYADALPYVRDAWDAVLEDLAASLDEEIRDELVTITRRLTNPEPEKRGHPRNLAGNGPAFGARRFSSRFEVLASRAEQRIRSGKAA